MSRTIAEHERMKYETMWQFPAYDIWSPGVRSLEHFKEMANPQPGQRVIDIGCGAGAASIELAKLGLNVTGLDITDAAWRHPNIEFIQASIWAFEPRVTWDFAYCCDMMEHLPTEFVALTIHRILKLAPRAFFSVAFMDDGYGEKIGETLHLTVRPFVWWRDLFREMGTLREARDQLRDQGTPSQGVFFVER